MTWYVDAGWLGEFKDAGAWRGRKQGRGSVKKGVPSEAVGGRKTGENCPGSGGPGRGHHSS